MAASLKIVRGAKKAGGNPVKLQTDTADTITLNSDAEEFQIHGGLWDGKTLYQLSARKRTRRGSGTDRCSITSASSA